MTSQSPPRIVVSLELFDYVFWLWRSAPSADQALQHAFAQKLLQAEAEGVQLAVGLNMVIDPWFQPDVLPALTMPKCLRLDLDTRQLVARGIEQLARGLSILLSRLCKQFPHLVEYHAQMLAAFNNFNDRFTEVFCEETPSPANHEAEQLASDVGQRLSLAAH